MEKIERTFEIEYSLEWEYGVEISKIREDLDALEKLGATHVEIDGSPDYDGCVSINIEAVSNRIETDEEHTQRVAENKQRMDNLKQKELEQLKNLKSKYPNG